MSLCVCVESAVMSLPMSVMPSGCPRRTHDWRYTVWLPSVLNANDTTQPNLIVDWTAANHSSPPRFEELYDHRGDDGTDYDWAGNNRNVAFDAAENTAVCADLFGKATAFFRDALPPAHPLPRAPPPPPPCVAGWREYAKGASLCRGPPGKHEKTNQRYAHFGTENVAGCKAKCKAAGPGKCKCLDVGVISTEATDLKHGAGPTCRLQEESGNVGPSVDGLTAYVPC